jgi:hypothetical protein
VDDEEEAVGMDLECESFEHAADDREGCEDVAVVWLAFGSCVSV